MPAAERLGERPCQDRQGDDGRHLHRRPEAGEERPAVIEEDQDRGDQPSRTKTLPRARWAPWRSTSAPRPTWRHSSVRDSNALRVRRNRPSPSMGNAFSRSAGRDGAAPAASTWREPILLRLTGQSVRSPEMRAAAVQLNSTADKARNLEVAERLVRARRRRRRGARRPAREVEPARRPGRRCARAPSRSTARRSPRRAAGRASSASTWSPAASPSASRATSGSSTPRVPDRPRRRARRPSTARSTCSTSTSAASPTASRPPSEPGDEIVVARGWAALEARA